MAKKNARNTRGKIVNAAWQLFYEQGYEDTTVEEIIELSHTSKGSHGYPYTGNVGHGQTSLSKQRALRHD